MKQLIPNPSPETHKRILETLGHIRDGWSKRKCIDWLSEKYDITDTRAYCIYHDSVYYMEIADDLFEDSAKAAKTIQKERLEEIINKSMESKQYNTAMRAIDLVNKLEQLYIEKQEIKVETDTIRFKFDE